MRIRSAKAVVMAVRAARWAAVCAVLSALAGCAAPVLEHEAGGAHVTANRPDGEAYAGKGELVLRLSVSAPDANLAQQIHATLGKARPETGRTELRYEGLDPSGNAVFSRRDVDLLARPPGSAPGGGVRSGDGAKTFDEGRNTEEIVVNLRVRRQIHIQGRTIEIIDAHPEGVVFRLYTDN